MPINPSISDLTWLLQPGDAGTNLAKGAQVGGLIARHMEANRDADLRQQQINMELAQLPLKQTLLQQHAQLNEYGLATALDQQQDRVEAGKAVAEFAPLMSEGLKAGKYDQLLSNYFDVLAKHPQAAGNPDFQKVPATIEAARRAQDLSEHYKAADAARLEAAKGAALRAQPKEVKLQFAIDDATTKANDAAAVGDDELAALYKGQAQSFQTQLDLHKQSVQNETQKQKNIADKNARLSATEERLNRIANQLDKTSLATMRQEQQVVVNSTALTDDDKLTKLQEIGNRYEARAKRRGASTPSAPATPRTAASQPPAPATVPATGEQVIVIDRRANSPTFGKKFSIDANDLEKADRAGYKQE